MSCRAATCEKESLVRPKGLIVYKLNITSRMIYDCKYNLRSPKNVVGFSVFIYFRFILANFLIVYT